ncbi:MAG: glycosyltransferase [Flavobacteriales bacterium]|nr:glycosyltransferase [Flavobacteriales bacterium]
MRIIFIAGTLGKGGAERQLYYICKMLQNTLFSVKVLCLTKDEYYEGEIKKIGVEVVHIGESESQLIRLYKIFKYVKKDKPTVLYSFHFYTNFYVGIIGRLLGIKSFGSIRSDGFSEKKANGFFSWLHYIFPHIIVANSPHGVKNVKSAFYNRSIKLLPNIIDLDFFTYKEKKQNIPLKLLFIGSLKKIKQPELFLKLIKELVRKKHNVKGLLIGKGNLEYSLKRDYADLPVEFLGIKDDVRLYLYESNYLISTSSHEGTPNVMLEAMACGTPILALYHQGLDEWIKKGMLTKNNDLQSLVHNIKSNLIDKEQLLKNRIYLEKNHSEEVVMRKFINIILN